MIETIIIDSMEKAAGLIMEQSYNENIDRLRSPYLYRGLLDASFPLATTLRRNCGEKQAVLERHILENFTKYAIREEPNLDASVWTQMIVGQHHGLPTRLLDWSHSSLVALHFATAEADPADTGRRDGVVWRIDTKEMAALMPERYRRRLEEDGSGTFAIRSLAELAGTLDGYDRDMGSGSMAIVEPPSIGPRIINQYAYFSVVPHGMTDIEAFLDAYTEHTVRYVIKKEIRWDLRDTLDQANMSERIIFPGLDGISKWIARHYYVKEKE